MGCRLSTGARTQPRLPPAPLAEHSGLAPLMLQHACGIMTNGSAVCWGKGSSGELTVPGGMNATWAAVSAGNRVRTASCALAS